MGVEADGFVQLNIYGTTVEDIQHRLGVLDILNNSGLHFVVLEFPPVFNVKDSQSAVDQEMMMDCNKMEIPSSPGMRSVHSFHADHLSTTTNSIEEEVVHQSYRSGVALDGPLHWENSLASYSPIYAEPDEPSGSLFSNSLDVNECFGGISIYSDSMANLMNSMESFLNQFGAGKNNSISRSIADEADEIDGTIRCLLAGILDNVCQSIASYENVQEADDDAMSFVTASDCDYFDDDHIEEFDTSELFPIEPTSNSEEMPPPDFPYTDSLVINTEEISNAYAECIADLIPKIDQQHIRSDDIVLPNEEMSECDADLSPLMIKLCDTSEEPTNSNPAHMTDKQAMEFNGHQRCSTSPWLEEEEHKFSVESTKKRALCASNKKKAIQCNYPGCGKTLAVTRHSRHFRPSRLARHAESHINNMTSCSYCGFTGSSIRSVRTHHGRKHPGVLFVGITRSEEDQRRVFEACFPDLVM